MRNVSRFRMRAHTLAVESSIWRSGNGHCGKCSCAAVQNEVHILFHCQDLILCSLKRKYLFLFFPFCQSLSREAPYILHALPRQIVFEFSLNGTTNSTISFWTLWTFFGRRRPATNQSA